MSAEHRGRIAVADSALDSIDQYIESQEHGDESGDDNVSLGSP